MTEPHLPPLHVQLFAAAVSCLVGGRLLGPLGVRGIVGCVILALLFVGAINLLVASP